MQAAMAGMVDRPFLASRNWAEQQKRADRFGAHPDIILFEGLLIQRMAKLGVPMFTHECWRSLERQADVYALGPTVTRAKPGRSAHNYGAAVDVVHSVHLWGLDKKAWALVGHVGKEIAASKGLAITWGGEFKSIYDPAHWELTHWPALKRVMDDGAWLQALMQRNIPKELENG